MSDHLGFDYMLADKTKRLLHPCDCCSSVAPLRLHNNQTLCETCLRSRIYVLPDSDSERLFPLLAQARMINMVLDVQTPERWMMKMDTHGFRAPVPAKWGDL